MIATANNQDLAARLDAMSAQIEWLVEQQRKRDELFGEMTPILREVMATATERLDAVEKRGWFAFARELSTVAERVLDHYTAEDVRALGGAIVTILDTVRALTRPEVLSIVGEASEALTQPERAEPIGLMGMMRASKQPDVQKGMAVLLSLLRNVGRASRALSDGDRGDAKARLAAVIGPRRKPRPQVAERALPSHAPAAAMAAGPACCTPASKPAEVATVVDGVSFTADGHLADPTQWTRPLAERIAAGQGVTLDEARWKLIECARGEFEKTNVAANIRRLTQLSGLSTRDIYELFPKAPGRTVARIAGTPKPAGCI